MFQAPPPPSLDALLCAAAARQSASATARTLAGASRRTSLDTGGDPRLALFAEGRAIAGGSFAGDR